MMIYDAVKLLCFHFAIVTLCLYVYSRANWQQLVFITHWPQLRTWIIIRLCRLLIVCVCMCDKCGNVCKSPYIQRTRLVSLTRARKPHPQTTQAYTPYSAEAWCCALWELGWVETLLWDCQNNTVNRKTSPQIWACGRNFPIYQLQKVFLSGTNHKGRVSHRRSIYYRELLAWAVITCRGALIDLRVCVTLVIVFDCCVSCACITFPDKIRTLIRPY